MKLTVRKIAQMAGVSPAAVSLVLNDKPGVRPELRQKLTALLEENGYTIRRKEEESSKKVLYLSYKMTLQVPYIRNEFTPHITAGVERVCRRKQYSLIIRNADETNLDEMLRNACDEKFAGIIFQGTEFQCSDYSRYEDFPIPLVVIDHHIYGNAVNTLNTDSESGCYQTLTHLKELGHTEIGYVTSEQNYGTFHDREKYFYQMMDWVNLPIRKEYIYHLDYFQEDLQADIRAQLDRSSRLPTAFVTGNDVLAAPLFFALTQKGYRIPEDMSIVGFDNSAAARMISPQLTTVDVEMEHFGEIAMERLIQMMEHPSRDVLKINTGTTLVVRGTTAPPRQQR